jgi:hypothetical protein
VYRNAPEEIGRGRKCRVRIATVLTWFGCFALLAARFAYEGITYYCPIELKLAISHEGLVYGEQDWQIS